MGVRRARYEARWHAFAAAAKAAAASEVAYGQVSSSPVEQRQTEIVVLSWAEQAHRCQCP